MTDPRIADLNATIERLSDALNDMCWQFAYDSDGPSLCTGGLSALEGAFDAMGWDDPYPIPESACDELGCTKRATCGTPTLDGYKRLCGEHFRTRVKDETL